MVTLNSYVPPIFTFPSGIELCVEISQCNTQLHNEDIIIILHKNCQLYPSVRNIFIILWEIFWRRQIYPLSECSIIFTRLTLQAWESFKSVVYNFQAHVQLSERGFYSSNSNGALLLIKGMWLAWSEALNISLFALLSNINSLSIAALRVRCQKGLILFINIHEESLTMPWIMTYTHHCHQELVCMRVITVSCVCLCMCVTTIPGPAGTATLQFQSR